jgi:hypothetical protein
MRETRTAGGRDEAKWKSEQEKQRRDQAIANTTGLRVLSEAVGQKVRQEFSAMARAKKEPKPVAKPAIKARNRPSVLSFEGWQNLPPLIFAA